MYCAQIIIGNVEFFDGDVHENALPYLYTVAVDGSGNPTKKVRFSTGNLQFKYQGSHQFSSTYATGTRQGTWRFAPQQYDMRGNDNSKINSLTSSYTTTWIDLFGYQTSQQASGDNYYQPWKCDGKHNNYGDGGSALMTYAKDWGRNYISNADNSLGWFTMSGEEWLVVVNEANARNVRYDCNSAGTVKLNGGGVVHGVILLPDSSGLIGWNEYCNPISCKPFVANHWSDFNANVYTEEQWSEMEAMGAIFLPCTGRRASSYTTDNGSNSLLQINNCLYTWSTSAPGSSGGNTSGEVIFEPTSFTGGLLGGGAYRFVSTGVQKNRAHGLSVRLVDEVPKSQW